MTFIPKDAWEREFPLEDAILNVGKGWEELIKECYQLCIENKVDIHQIKEKFGGLRFYTGRVRTENSREFLDAIHAIETRSYTVCENCGETGKLDRARGWWKTLCSNCTNVSREDLPMGKAKGISHLWRPTDEELREQILNSNDPDDTTRLHEGELT